jgi:hypothetical protein
MNKNNNYEKSSDADLGSYFLHDSNQNNFKTNGIHFLYELTSKTNHSFRSSFLILNNSSNNNNNNNSTINQINVYDFYCSSDSSLINDDASSSDKSNSKLTATESTITSNDDDKEFERKKCEAVLNKIQRLIHSYGIEKEKKQEQSYEYHHQTNNLISDYDEGSSSVSSNRYSSIYLRNENFIDDFFHIILSENYKSKFH